MLRKYASMTVLSAKMGDESTSFVKTGHRHDFDGEYDERPGYLYVHSRAISSRVNENYDGFDGDEIAKSYQTFHGKPVFISHHNSDPKRARGVIVAEALHPDFNHDGSPDTWVEVVMEVDAKTFPKLAKAILAGRVNRTSMGCDVERSQCSACNNWATTPMEYCAHIPRAKGQRIFRTTAGSRKKGQLIFEQCYGLSFFENSLLLEPPADPTAHVLNIKVASKVDEVEDIYGILSVEAGAKPDYPNPGDHPFFQKHPVSSDQIVKHFNENTNDDEKTQGRRWYPDAKHVATSITTGDHPKGKTHLGAGVLSAYSTRTDWPANMFNASRSFQEHRAVGIGEGVSIMGNHQRSAQRIMNGEDHKDVLKAPKTGTFARLVEHGGKDPDTGGESHDVVIDRHAMSVATGHRMSQKDLNEAPLSSKHYYNHVANAYRKAAQTISDQTGQHWAPHHLQAATWLSQVRMNHDADAERGNIGKGRQKVKEKNENTWREHHTKHYPDPGDRDNSHFSSMMNDHILPEQQRRLNTEYGDQMFNSPAPAYTPGGAHCPECAAYRASREAHPPLGGYDALYGTGDDDDTYHRVSSVQDQNAKPKCDNCDGQGEVGTHQDSDGNWSTRECPSCKGTGEDEHRTAMRKNAIGEQIAPPVVNTLRDEGCPVCSDPDFDGDRCRVCLFVQPPKFAQDPNLELAQQVDLRQNQMPNEPMPMDQTPLTPEDVMQGQGPQAGQMDLDNPNGPGVGMPGQGGPQPGQPGQMDPNMNPNMDSGQMDPSQMDPNQMATQMNTGSPQNPLNPNDPQGPGQPGVDGIDDPYGSDPQFGAPQNGVVPQPGQDPNGNGPLPPNMQGDSYVPPEGFPSEDQGDQFDGASGLTDTNDEMMPGQQLGPNQQAVQGQPGMAPDGQTIDDAHMLDNKPDLQCPSCGNQFASAPPMSVTQDVPDPQAQQGVAEGDVCPACGKALLVAIGSMPQEDAGEDSPSPDNERQNGGGPTSWGDALDNDRNTTQFGKNKLSVLVHGGVYGNYASTADDIYGPITITAGAVRVPSRELQKGDHVVLHVGPMEGTPMTAENVSRGGAASLQGHVLKNTPVHLHIQEHGEDGPTSMTHDNIRNSYKLDDGEF